MAKRVYRNRSFIRSFNQVQQELDRPTNGLIVLVGIILVAMIMVGLIWQKVKVTQLAQEIEQLAGPVAFFLHVFFGHIAVFQAEGDVVEDGLVGKQGIILKDHAQVALVNRNVVDPFALDVNIALRRHLQPGNHSKGCRFSAA